MSLLIILANRPTTSPGGHPFKRYLSILVFGLLLFSYFHLQPSSERTESPSQELLSATSRLQPSCSPEGWSSGEWVFKPHNYTKPVTTQDDILAYAGLEAIPPGLDMRFRLGWEPKWIREYMPLKTAWRWQPGTGCRMDPFNKEAVVRHLVEKGGWFLTGDSNLIERWHALGCQLYPHIVKAPGDAYPMHFHLNPNSSLVPTLDFPPGFDVATTPLLSTQRVDLLFNLTELDSLYRARFAPPADFVLRKDPPLWPSFTYSPADYMARFTAPLPRGGYSALVATTGGHWSGVVFNGLKDVYRTHEFGAPLMARVMEFVEAVIPAWARTVDAAVAEHNRKTESRRIDKKIVVLSSVTAHPDCRNQLLPWGDYNMSAAATDPSKYMHHMNAIFKSTITGGQFPSISYLGIERAGLLRPDAHLGLDCQHMLTGAGVMEAEMHYLFHHVQHGGGGHTD